MGKKFEINNKKNRFLDKSEKDQKSYFRIDKFIFSISNNITSYTWFYLNKLKIYF